MVVRWTQRNPKALTYRKLPGALEKGTHLRMYSDAAFKKEEEDGHSQRGAIYMRCVGNTQKDMICTSQGHLIEMASKQQRRVVRATFTAELQGGCDTVDKGFLLVQTFHEITTGQSSAIESRRLRDHGGYKVPMILYIDAMSVYAAVTATFVKTPAEQGQLCHLHFVRELLDNNILFALAWTDTRDMIGDGMTKGAVDRLAIHDAMSGNVKVAHEMKLWRPTQLARCQAIAAGA